LEPPATKNHPTGDAIVSFLLDTDICSAYLKGDRRLSERFIQYGGHLNVSALSAAELFAWVLRAKAPRSRLLGLQAFLADVAFLDVNRDVSRRFGEIRSRQLDRGLFTPELDLLIASTALTHDLILVTHNVGDFSQVADLKLQDWLIN
jgi:tRNA(fMet)-specific endonuclease VapC